MRHAARSLALAVLAAPALQAGDFSPAAHHAWSPNSGWLSLRQGSDGVRVHERFLAGYAWEQNTGWIDFGDGSPTNGHRYANDGAGDFGVNLEADGRLTGFAWSPNTGWIHFEQTHGQPRLDWFTGRLQGHAWSPNLGWINLGDGIAGPIALSRTVIDVDADGLEDSWESFHFDDLTTANATSDHDGDGSGDAAEAEADTDPRDPADFFRVIRIDHVSDPGGEEGGDFVDLEWRSSPRRRYELLAAEPPGLGPFLAVPGFGEISGQSGSTSTQISVAPGTPRRFWQVQVRHPLPTPSK